MATEEAELSFIRCPGCRSLVPAIARRCKMCGFVLDSGEKDRPIESENIPSASDNAKKSRVRQRTVTVSANEIDSIKSSLYNKTPDIEPDETEESDEMEFEDSVDVVHAEASEPPLDLPIIDQSPEDSIEELDEDSLEENTDDVKSDPKPRLRVKRRKKRKRKLRTDIATEPASDNSSGVELRVLPNPNGFVAQPASSKATKLEEVKDLSEDSEGLDEEQELNSGKKVDIVKGIDDMKTDKKSSHDDGMLVGWFVFSGTKGREARELRAGKYFLSGEKLRPTDFVIAHPSLSTPHCLLDVRPGKPLRVQDLMSESGTSIRRAGGDGFEKCAETVEVFHGDTVRFGEEEVLLCLIP